MKKSILFSILFFLATAVILVYSTSCEKYDAPVDLKVLRIGDKSYEIIDKEGNAKLHFKGHASDPDVTGIEYSVTAVEGVPSDKTSSPTTKAAGGTVRVVSTGTDCTVYFHANDPATFTGATIIVTASKLIYNDGRVRLFLSPSASASAAGTILPLPVDPDDPEDPEDPDDPDEPENELDQLLEKAEALEDNTFLVDDNLYTVNPEIDGGYICYHNYYISEDDDEDTLVGHTIHCLNGKLSCGVNIELLVDRIGEAFEIPIVDYIVTKKSDFEEILQFVALKNPSLPYNYDSNPRIYYSSKGNVADHCVIAERAVVKVVENEDESMTAIAYLLAEDGTECYAKFTAFNPSYIK